MAEHTIPLGHVTIVPKGDYDSSVTYNRLDLVTQKDENNKIIGLYISKINDNLNNPLPDSETESESWMKIMTQSDYQGPIGDTGPDGRGIRNIIGPTNPGQVGETDSYTINYTDNTSYTFTIKNGVTGPAAGFGNPTYSITGTTGPLKVTIGTTGPNTAKIFDFKFEIPEGPGSGSGSSNVTWGNIGGSISNQTDLQEILNSKANNANLGTMAMVDDVPSDDKIYGRNNAGWIEITNSGGSSGGNVILKNPINITKNNDQLNFGLFESGTAGEWNIALKASTTGNSIPDITVQQIDKDNNIVNLTLLDTEGNTNIPNKLTAKDLELINALPVAQGGTGYTEPGLQLLDNLGIHVTNAEPDENTVLPTGHILLVYEE